VQLLLSGQTFQDILNGADYNAAGQITREWYTAWEADNIVASYYRSNQWYQLQMTVNPGGQSNWVNYPMDWPYLTAFDEYIANKVGSDTPAAKALLRNAAGITPDLRYFNGQPPANLTIDSPWPGTKFTLIDKSVEIAPGLFLVKTVSDSKGTLELNELSLAIRTPQGLAVIVAARIRASSGFWRRVAVRQAALHRCRRPASGRQERPAGQ